MNAVGKGATPDYLFTFLAQENGLDLSAIEMDYSLPPTQLAQMAAAGQVETVLVPQPFVTLILMKNPEMKIRLNLQDEWQRVQNTADTYPMTALVINPDFAAEHPEAVKELLERYEDSINWVLEQPAEAAVLIEKYDILAAAVAQKAIPLCGLDFSPALDVREDVENFLLVLLNSDPVSIGGSLPDDGFYLAP